MNKNKLYIFLVILLFNIVNCDILFSSFDSKIDNLVSSLSKVKDKSIKKIAVVNFIDTTSKQRFPFSDILEEDLITKIINTRRFKVIVKSRIDEVLKELKFGLIGLVDPKKSKQFGKLSQADAILTGTYFKKRKDIIINAQLIDIETGEAIWAGKTSIPEKDLPVGAFQLPNIYQEAPVIPVGEKERVVKPKPRGTLSIVSFPSGAEVFLDAKRMGITPAIFQSAIVGERNVTLVKDGYEDYIEKIKVKANETSSVRVTMKRQTGTLKIKTVPSGVEIYIDGYKKGVSPLNIKLNIGSYKVKAKKENYTDYEDTITISYKEVQNKTFSLIEEPGSLLIKIQPSPANVYIDNEWKGTAKPTLSLEKFPSGKHTIRITKDGYQDFYETVNIRANKSETISIVLKKAEEPKHERYEVKYKPPKKRFGPPSGIDVYVSYRNLSPKNERFKKMVGSLSSIYIGSDIASIFGASIDFWQKDSLNGADGTELSVAALELTLTYPYGFSDYFLIYGGGGGRFESIDVTPSSGGEPAATFGNNAFLITAGAKLRIFTDNSQKSSIGIEINYSFTIGADYTNYNMFRIGVLYGWSLE